MKKKIQRRIHIHFLLFVEGISDRALIAWLQDLCKQQNLAVHLKAYPLGGGGYQRMLKTARHCLKKNHKVRNRFLVVDIDRAIKNEDNWTLDKLQQEAAKDSIEVIFLRPKLEGVLLRLFPGMEHVNVSPDEAQSSLRRKWPDYDKSSLSAKKLNDKFNLEDLRRVALVDAERDNLRKLLKIIGLLKHE